MDTVNHHIIFIFIIYYIECMSCTEVAGVKWLTRVPFPLPRPPGEGLEVIYRADGIELVQISQVIF
jgi:hypothetical protein